MKTSFIFLRISYNRHIIKHSLFDPFRYFQTFIIIRDSGWVWDHATTLRELHQLRWPHEHN